MNAIDELRKNDLPDYLVDALNMETDEAFKKSLEAIKKMKGESSAQDVGKVIVGYGNLIGTVTNGSYNDDIRTAFGLK